MSRRSKFWSPQPKLFGLPSLEPLPAGEQDPAELFLDLCSWTVPHGGEDIYYGNLLARRGFKRDAYGNYSLEIPGEKGLATTCFMAHLDTADHCALPVTRTVKDGVCGTDGKTILGADDRAGVTVLLHLASRDVPGLYYLFAGEEAGCKGSSAVSLSPGLPDHITKAISFDRKGKTSVVTHQCNSRTCSNEFAQALANELNSYGFEYEPDPGGVFTDSREFAPFVSECTNISVGYYNQHSNNETQDLEFLAYLCRVCVEIDWEALPATRDPNVVDCDLDYDDEPGSWGSWDWKNDYPISASEKVFLADPEGEAYAAIERISEDFLLSHTVDREDIRRLIQKRDSTTVDMIEMLIDELRRQATAWMDGG